MSTISWFSIFSGFSARAIRSLMRSEEHTSELQSQSNLVCRLLLEKKKNNTFDRLHYFMTCAVTFKYLASNDPCTTILFYVPLSFQYRPCSAIPSLSPALDRWSHRQ